MKNKRIVTSLLSLLVVMPCLHASFLNRVKTVAVGMIKGLENTHGHAPEIVKIAPEGKQILAIAALEKRPYTGSVVFTHKDHKGTLVYDHSKEWIRRKVELFGSGISFFEQSDHEAQQASSFCDALDCSYRNELDTSLKCAAVVDLFEKLSLTTPKEFKKQTPSLLDGTTSIEWGAVLTHYRDAQIRKDFETIIKACGYAATYRIKPCDTMTTFTDGSSLEDVLAAVNVSFKDGQKIITLRCGHRWIDQLRKSKHDKRLSFFNELFFLHRDYDVLLTVLWHEMGHIVFEHQHTFFHKNLRALGVLLGVNFARMQELQADRFCMSQLTTETLVKYKKLLTIRSMRAQVDTAYESPSSHASHQERLQMVEKELARRMFLS